MIETRTLTAYLKARGLSRAELARRLGLTRQAVSLWFKSERANIQGRHLIRLGEVLGVPVERLSKPLPGFDADTHSRLMALLLWDRLYPDLDDLAVAVLAHEPKALARLVEVHGLYAAEAAVGGIAWRAFPEYKRHIHPVRRRELETLWTWHETRTAA